MGDNSNQLAELLLANVPTGAWLQDGAGRCLWSNAALARLLGRTPADLWPAEIAPTLAAAAAEVRSNHTARTLVLAWAGSRWLEIELHPVAGAGAAQIAGLVRDVTGHQPAQTALPVGVQPQSAGLPAVTGHLAEPDSQCAHNNSAAPVVFDEPVVRAWIGADDALLHELIKSYLADGATRLTRIDAALQAGDAQTADMQAHTLKGSSGISGMVEMQRLSTQLNDLVRCNNLTGAQAVMPELRAALERVRAIRLPELPTSLPTAPPTPAASTAPAVLDPIVTARLRELAAATDPAFLRELYEAFLSSSIQYLVTIREAVTTNNAEDLRKAAHALRGASANIGAKTLADRCRQLEELGAAGQVTGDVPGLEQEFALVKTEIANQAVPGTVL